MDLFGRFWTFGAIFIGGAIFIIDPLWLEKGFGVLKLHNMVFVNLIIRLTGHCGLERGPASCYRIWLLCLAAAGAIDREQVYIENLRELDAEGPDARLSGALCGGSCAVMRWFETW